MSGLAVIGVIFLGMFVLVAALVFGRLYYREYMKRDY